VIGRAPIQPIGSRFGPEARHVVTTSLTARCASGPITPGREMPAHAAQVTLTRPMVVVAVIAVVWLIAAGHAEAQPQPGSRRPTHGAADDAPFTDADRRAVLAVTEAYRDAWLANEAEGVMATLSKEAVLLPSGMQPIAGETAIRRFWFPPGAAKTVVTAMELSVDEVRGSGKLAFVRGRGSLTFVTHSGTGASAPRTQRSWFMNVLERQPNGGWLIVRRMWSDLR
jgi:uncharacterized protein (TIGR02246 family)